MATYKRHFGQFRGEEVIVLGYNKSMNAVLICRANSLPSDEQADLRRIASSTTAQNLDYLVPTLRVERHKSNQDWFTHLVTRLYRNDGAVLNVPLKEMENMNEQQKGFFKGYGNAVEPNGGPSSRVGADNEFSTGVSGMDDEIIVAEKVTPDSAPRNLQEAELRGLAPTPRTDPEMARAAAQNGGIDPVQKAMLEALQNINTTLAAQSEALAKLKPARATRKKRAAKKAPARAVAPANDNATV